MKNLTIEITKERDMFYVYANDVFKCARIDKAEALAIASELEREFLNPASPEIVYSKIINKPE